jgi:hypothetical protein
MNRHTDITLRAAGFLALVAASPWAHADLVNATGPTVIPARE